MNVDFYTIAPSPHLVEVLDALHERPSVDLRVVYEQKSLSEREWGTPHGQARSVFLESRDLIGWGQRWDREIVRVMSSENPDVVIVSTSYASLNTYALIHILKRQEVPFVLWSERLSRLSGWFVDRVRRIPVQWILDRASGFVGPTQSTVDFFNDQFRFEGSSLAVPYHRDLSPFLEHPLLREAPERVQFLIVGGLIPRKGVDTVLRALENVDSPTDLTILGEGPEKKRLIRLAERQEIHDIEFLGAVPYDRVPKHMKDAHVLLFPSRHDGFGMVTMEALASGRPVVASDCVMSAHEFIRPDENGWIVPVDDIEAWSSAIQQVLRDRKSLPRMSRAARATVRCEYDLAQDAANLETFLKEVVDTGETET